MISLIELEQNILDIKDGIIKIRRHIHQYPELGYEEEKTSKLVAKELQEYGIEVKEGVGGYGVVGLLRGSSPGKTILLRADMDALPIQEETGLPFASRIPGKMHACGHDVHTAILLGVARVLSNYKEKIQGNIKFMFQPAEECNPQGGAKAMIEAGVLKNPEVDYALALHVWPDLYVGEIGIAKGPISAQSDRVFMNILGKSGHASAPHQGIDSVVVASHLIANLQTIISRRVNPRDSVVITLGKISGGQRYNVLCDRVELEGTVRIMTPGYEDKIPQLLKQVGEGIASAHGAQFSMEYIKGYPMVINDDKLTSIVEEFLTSKIKDITVKNIGQDTSGEDFSFVAQQVPSVYMKLGSTPVGAKEFMPLHNSKVIFEEESISYGIKTLVAASLQLLTL